MAQGVGIISFGATPVETAVDLVSGEALLTADSHVEAFIMHGDSTGDNDADAHSMMAALGRFSCKVVTPGDSFETLCELEGEWLAEGDFEYRWVYN